MLQKKYPFDPQLKHHLLLAVGLAIWIFCFLVFTEPLDVNEFSSKEKWQYLPFYGICGGCTYLIFLPLQKLLFKKNTTWTVQKELLFILGIIIIGGVLARLIYLYIIVPNEPNAYSVSYFITSIYIPALTAILPIIIFGRWAFGKYEEKKLEDQKIKINGEGNYEGLVLHSNDLISIKADDNYIEVLYIASGLFKKHLIRNKLSVIEKEHPQLIRTHRSYLINPFHFKRWKTGQGKLIAIMFSDIEIPVSKTYAKIVKEVLSSF